MSLWSRIANAFRDERLSREIDEEIQAHLAEAIEQGRDPAEAHRAFGSVLRRREESRDIRLIPWLESLRADAIFGWRQLMKNKVVSAAAILSLGLAIGACTAAFRLIDALLLRPLPVANAERLYEVSRRGAFNGTPTTYNAWAYPSFQQMRATVKHQAELIAVSNAEPVDLTFKSDEEMERAYLQYVSGWMFASFEMRPALGRLLSENDDLQPGAHPYAVISYDYWSRRFGRDINVIGRSFHQGDRLYRIVGVTQESFTGTQPGTMVDVFVPMMMQRRVLQPDWNWHRSLALLKPGVAVEPLRQQLQAISRSFDEARLNGATSGMPKEMVDRFFSQTVLLQPAASGASNLRSETHRPLAILGSLVALVLLIACANVANLMTAQAEARAREMALRVSIGGGRWRMVQLVLVQSVWLTFLAASIGGGIAWWAGPFVVGMINPPDNPARLLLPADWRVLGFGLVLALGVTLSFGLAPALRASSVNPASTLKGGENPHSRQRWMHTLVATQVAFCFLVLFVAGLLVATFERLSRQSTGFSSDRLLVLDATAKRPQPPAIWNQLIEHLRAMRGVEAVAQADQPLLGPVGWSNFVSIDGAPPNGVLVSMLSVSPGWVGAMKIPLFDGRDFVPGDSYPGSSIVNETFARTYLHGENPVGRTFEIVFSGNLRQRFRAVGLVGDVRYRTMRESIRPQVYVPLYSVGGKGAPREIGNSTLILRTTAPNALALAQFLRREVPRTRPEFRVSRIRTQLEINQSHTVHERLLATLALFFAVVALVLAGVGLYGVLHYSVLQRRREIGIRLAIGARAGDIARSVTVDAFSMVLVGAVVGLVLGMVSNRHIESLLYEVKATDVTVLLIPSLAILCVALLAALPAVIRAVRIDPVQMLRSD